MIGTKDNILEVTKHLEEQNLQYILAVWQPTSSKDDKDNVTIYTTFEKNEIMKLSDALKDSILIKEPNLKKKKE